MREDLQLLSASLREVGEDRLVGMVETAISGPEEALEAFLVSNDLWAGAGSIADQGGVGRDGRRKVEQALILLGNAQIGAGLVNCRTASWTDAFRSR